MSYIVLEVDTRLKSGWNVRSDIFVNIELLPNKKKKVIALKNIYNCYTTLTVFKKIYIHIYILSNFLAKINITKRVLS